MDCCYDNVCNIRTKTTGDITTTYNYNDLDQLQNIQTSDSVIQASYTYDLSGNRASMTSYGNTVTYTYDGQNNMISTGEGITYTYDAKGERLTKTVGSDTYSYYYNGVNLLFTKKNGETEAQYFYAGDEVYGASGSDATAYWYCTDVRGSVTSIHKGMTDSSTWTELEYSYAYDAYGETTVSEEATTHTLINDVAYTGAIIDRETGLYYLMSRYYDPSIGQFISEDSYRGEGESFWHLYKYCDNDPINKTDRNGKYGLWVANSNKLKIKGTYGVGNADSFYNCRIWYSKANCFGFALGFNMNMKTETLKKYASSPFKFNKKQKDVYNVEKWFDATVGFLKAKKKYARRLVAGNSKIFPNERRVAIRCMKEHSSYKPKGCAGNETDFDYHYMRQINNGNWAGKNGTTNEFVSNMKNIYSSWNRGKYDSKIIFFAVSNYRFV